MKNKKELGQHWLYNRAILNEIADLAFGGTELENDEKMNSAVNRGGEENLGICPKNDPCKAFGGDPYKLDTCLEIGPGLGTLTSSLLKRFEKVIAVEFDADLARKLPGSFPGKNLEVINEDFLKFDLSSVAGPYAIAGNIPYYITSPIIEKIVTAENRPVRAVLLMQKEVAERVAAGTIYNGRVVKGGQSVLSLMVQNRASVELGPVVPAEEFTPSPQVDSQVLVLTPHEPTYPEEMFAFVRRGFASPRKKLIHNLPCKEALVRFGISPDVRPADLNLAQWYDIMKSC